MATADAGFRPSTPTKVAWRRRKPPGARATVEAPALFRFTATPPARAGTAAWEDPTMERCAQEPAVAADRERIARDLHDTVGQTLYAIGLALQDVLCDVTDPALARRLEPLRALASQGVADMRSAVYALSFLHVRESGFVPSLRTLALQFRQSTGVEAHFRVHGDLPRLPEEVESALYRMAHEALVNVERHARATGVVISLSALDAAVELSIRDDGVGLDQRQAADWQSFSHFGLRTVARSIEAVGGRFAIVSIHPRGVHAYARVPLRAARRATS